MLRVDLEWFGLIRGDLEGSGVVRALGVASCWGVLVSLEGNCFGVVGWCRLLNWLRDCLKEKGAEVDPGWFVCQG